MTLGRIPAHTSTNGCPVTSTWGLRTRIGQATFLRPGHEVIEQHTEAALRCRVEGRDGLGEVVGAMQRLDDDAAVAQFVTPHQLEQLGIVATFHPDPARRRDPGSGRRRWPPTPTP